MAFLHIFQERRAEVYSESSKEYSQQNPDPTKNTPLQRTPITAATSFHIMINHFQLIYLFLNNVFFKNIA